MKKAILHWYDKLLSLLLSIMGFGGTFVLMGCPVEYGPDPDFINVHPDKLVFPAEGGVKEEITISTEGKWTITQIPTFVSVSETSGNGNSHVYVTAEKNDSYLSRQAVITIGKDVEIVTVTIYQQGK